MTNARFFVRGPIPNKERSNLKCIEKRSWVHNTFNKVLIPITINNEKSILKTNDYIITILFYSSYSTTA